MNKTAVIAYRSSDMTGEGCLWHPSLNRLFWVDIEGCVLNELMPESGNVNSYKMPGMVTTVVPNGTDGLIVTVGRNIYRFNPQANELIILARLEENMPNNRCNDGKCDPAGRFWVGTMSLSVEKDAGALYRYADGEMPVKVLSGQTIPNGIVWSKDGRMMYYIDSATRCIFSLDFNLDTGEVANKRIAVEVPSEMGLPDGMAMDIEGMLWVAHWGGFGVYRWNPNTGMLLEKVEVPVPNVASCAFGGDDYKTLYITTARAGLSEEEIASFPLSGSLFVCKPLVAGCAPNRFKSLLD